MFTNSDWSGEQVKVQNRLKKFVLHAGQVEMMDSALLRLVLRASSYSNISKLETRRSPDVHTWSLSQQTSLSFHVSPQSPTSFSRTSFDGVSARLLFGHGNSLPNHDCFPQCPFIAHLPASCLRVQLPSFPAIALLSVNVRKVRIHSQRNGVRRSTPAML